MKPNQLKRFHAADEHVFANLISSNEPTWRQIIGRFAPNDPDLADDLFEKVCEKIFERRHTYGGVGSLEGWCAKICQHVCFDFVRGADRAPKWIPLLEESLRDETDSRSEEQRTRFAEAIQARGDAVDDAIIALPPRMRDVVIACYFLDWDVPRIAREFHLKHSTVWTTLSKARAILRPRLERQARPPEHTPV